MPEISADSMTALRDALRVQLLRAADALADDRLDDDDALALTRNTAAAALMMVDTVDAATERRPALAGQ